jgi:hypothetical protein
MKLIPKIFLLLFSLSAIQAFSEVVLDSDDNNATFGGTWTQSTTAPGFYGTDYATAQGGGTSDTARFFSPRPITSTGNWCIQVRWTQGANRSSSAQFQVFDGSTLRNTFTVNQQINGNAWRRIGCVTLSSGLTSEVRLTDAGAPSTSFVVADGVRWVWEETAVNQDFCIAVNGGWNFGGVTFIGKNFTAPANGTCKPWVGMMKAATTVVGTSSGAACKSNDGKLLTVSLQTTAPEWQGPGVIASDHIELCPLASTQGCPAHAGQSDRGTNAGPATQVACTSAMSTIPSSHD